MKHSLIIGLFLEQSVLKKSKNRENQFLVNVLMKMCIILRIVAITVKMNMEIFLNNVKSIGMRYYDN